MTDRLERLLNLVIALRETRLPLTAEQIRTRIAGYGQADHEAFRRMFERDKADLRALGVPIETAAVDRWEATAGYRIDPRRYDLPEVALTAGEVAALTLALRATGMDAAAGTGMRKLAVDSDAADAPPLSGTAPSALELELAVPHLQSLSEAQVERVRVRFAYRPLGGDESVRTVEPYALVHRRGRWYLVGRDVHRDDRRAFRLDRITGPVSRVGEPGAFSLPDDAVSPADVVPTAAASPATAEVAASPDVAWQVARRAHGAGRQRPDGWADYTVAVPDPQVFVGWALDFADDLVVREPASLRQAVVEALHAAAGCAEPR